MNHLIKNSLKKGYNDIVRAGHAGLEYTELAILNLGAGESYEEKLDGKELVGVILGGKCTVTVTCATAARSKSKIQLARRSLGEGGNPKSKITWADIGARNNVFGGKATGFYLPVGTKMQIESSTGANIALCRAPSQLECEPILVTPQDVRVNTVGRHNWRREVHNIIHFGHKCRHLVVGETYNPPGNWSSFPPHCHEKDNPPIEADMEEVYHFRISPSNGFGFQRIYKDDRSVDAVYTLHDGDTVVIPDGYHPVAAAPGHRLYYLWILAGKRRELFPRDDPNYAWVKNCEAVIDGMT